MDSVKDWVTLFAILTAVISIASFFLGRSKASVQKGKEEGCQESELKHVSDAMSKMEKAIEGLSTKIDISNERMASKIDGANKEREMEYREMLIKATRLEESYKSLHLRVDFMENKLQISREDEK